MIFLIDNLITLMGYKMLLAKKNLNYFSLVLCAWFVTGCASVPMASLDRDTQLKKFNPPPANKSALYVYRDSFIGQALKKTVYLDKKILGETANKVYFYKLINPGSHLIATSSEFGQNGLKFNAAPGKNYFVKQYIKPGLIVGGSNVALVDETVGKNAVLRCKLAQSN